jgi:hypothetical protein
MEVEELFGEGRLLRLILPWRIKIIYEDKFQAFVTDMQSSLQAINRKERQFISVVIDRKSSPPQRNSQETIHTVVLTTAPFRPQAKMCGGIC